MAGTDLVDLEKRLWAAADELCRLDAAASSRPVRAKTSNGEQAFYVRMNNSSRALTDGDAEAFILDRWP